MVFDDNLEGVTGYGIGLGLELGLPMMGLSKISCMLGLGRVLGFRQIELHCHFDWIEIGNEQDLDCVRVILVEV